MFDWLMKLLTTHDTDSQNCRDQSYDNAWAMSRKFSSLLAKGAAENQLAEWIPFTDPS